IIARLIQPCALDDFLDRYWQKQPLVVNRAEPVYNTDILTLDDIDQLFSTTAIPVSQVDLGKSAVGVPKAAYGDGMDIRPLDVLRLHKQGNTIILRAMHLWLRKLRTLCEAAEAVFHCAAQANVYMTPEGTRSSYPHWDAHDIFVIQVAGSKRWILHDS